MEAEFSSQEEFDQALNGFMATLPAKPQVQLEQLFRAHNTLCNEIGHKHKVTFEASKTAAELRSVVHFDITNGLFPNRLPPDTCISAVFFPQAYVVHGESGPVHSLASHARDNYGNSVISWGKELEVYTQGPVLALTWKDKFLSEDPFTEFLYSRSALEEGLRNLEGFQITAGTPIDDLPYLLWLGINKISSGLTVDDLNIEQTCSVDAVDPQNKTLFLRCEDAMFEIAFSHSRKDCVPTVSAYAKIN